MSYIRFFALLPLLAMATTTVADAGTTIRDARYWPDRAHPKASVGSSAQKARPSASQRRSGAARNEAPRFWTYRGGPKTGVWSSR